MKECTDDKIANAFLDLIKEKGIEDVSVVNICKKAHISRDTFYYYFQDKYNLISWIYGRQKSSIMEEYFTKEPWSDTVCRVLKLIRKFSTFYHQGFADSSYQNLEMSMKDFTYDMSVQVILELTGSETLSEEMKFFIKFDSYGSVAMTREWVQSGMETSEEDLALLLAESMPEEMKKIWDTFSCNSKWEEPLEEGLVLN